MYLVKPWYASKAVWGAVVTIIGSVLQMLRFEVDAALLQDVEAWVFSLVTLLGGAVALWGRLRATKRIDAAATNV